LGRLLVEQGLLTGDELELALAKQEETGKRLGETIVECGFVSGPELASALASQYGIDLPTESGFGTGLRSQIQRRHENERGRGVRPRLVAVADLTDTAAVEEQAPAEAEPDGEREAVLLAQLEEQWAKLAAAEAKLADRELELAKVTRDYGRRRAQVARFARRIHVQDERLRQSLQDLHELTADAEKLVAQVEELSAQSRSRDDGLERLREVEAELEARELELSKVDRDHARRRAQVARFVGRARVRDERLRQSLQDLHDVTEVAEQLRAQVEELSTQVRSRDERIERLGEDLRGCDAEIERQRSRVDELSTQVRSRDERIERLTDDVRGCDEEIERLRAQVPTVSAPPDGHLVLVQLGDRYELLEREGSPPGCGAPLELPELCDGLLVVAGSGRSPFPGDARPCAFAQRGNPLAVRSS
jgi:DNA repair exonuclease SbcCD ATPase subunit